MIPLKIIGESHISIIDTVADILRKEFKPEHLYIWSGDHTTEGEVIAVIDRGYKPPIVKVFRRTVLRNKRYCWVRADDIGMHYNRNTRDKWSWPAEDFAKGRE